MRRVGRATSAVSPYSTRMEPLGRTLTPNAVRLDQWVALETGGAGNGAAGVCSGPEGYPNQGPICINNVTGISPYNGSIYTGNSRANRWSGTMVETGKKNPQHTASGKESAYHILGLASYRQFGLEENPDTHLLPGEHRVRPACLESHT
jgi:hypothetical protein